MFAEEPIFGKNEMSVDEKGRIFIPAYTKREPGEDLVLIENKDLDAYEIYSVLKLKERYEELNKLMYESTKKADKRKYQKMILEISKSIILSRKVDKQGRILTGKVFEGCDKVSITGVCDHLIIEKIKK